MPQSMAAIAKTGIRVRRQPAEELSALPGVLRVRGPACPHLPQRVGGSASEGPRILATTHASTEERPMAVSFQLVIDCADPEPLARFWAAALGYELEPPPDGFASWDAYWRDLGVPEDELGTGADCIVDPGGRGPRIWFQVVPDRKAAKNRLHLDIGVSGGRAVPGW